MINPPITRISRLSLVTGSIFTQSCPWQSASSMYTASFVIRTVFLPLSWITCSVCSVPKGRLLLLDYFAENTPVDSSYVSGLVR